MPIRMPKHHAMRSKKVIKNKIKRITSFEMRVLRFDIETLCDMTHAIIIYWSGPYQQHI